MQLLFLLFYEKYAFSESSPHLEGIYLHLYLYIYIDIQRVCGSAAATATPDAAAVAKGKREPGQNDKAEGRRRKATEEDKRQHQR